MKTTCFNNTISKAEHEGKLPQSRWSFSAHNFSNSGYFHKIFGMHFQEGLFFLYTSPLLYFWNYNPSLNGQIISLIGAQFRSQIHLLRAEWYKVLKILHCRVSPILYIKFPSFFRWKATYENPSKGLQKGKENYWNSFWNYNLESQSLLGVFLWDKFIFDFVFGRGAWFNVCNTCTYIQKKSYFHVFLEKDHLSFSVQRKKSCFWEKNTTFSDNTRKIIFRCNFIE